MKRNRQVMYPSDVAKPRPGRLAPQQKVGRNADGTRRDWRAGELRVVLKPLRYLLSTAAGRAEIDRCVPFARPQPSTSLAVQQWLGTLQRHKLNDMCLRARRMEAAHGQR